MNIFNARNLKATSEKRETDTVDAAYQLIGEEENSLETEFAVAKIEKILKRGTEQVENHGVVVTFRTIPANEGNADTTCKGLVDFRLVLELGVLGFD